MKSIDRFRDFLRRTYRQPQIWDTVPTRSKIIFLGTVFCLFAAVGAMSQLDSQTASRFRLFASALYTGIFAIVLAWAAIRRAWLWLIVIVPIFLFVTPTLFSHLGRRSLGGPVIPDAVKPWLSTTSLASMFMMMAAYALMMTFIAREGDRFFRTHTEIQLAGEIHKALVAPIHREIAGYEFYGISLASGAVGGDLVDVIERDGHWLAYVADVAGHGVSSGVLMAMIKSAANMSMRFDPEADGLLPAINDVLCSLKTGNMFATFAFLSWSADRGLRYSLAGHLPILLCRGGTVHMFPAQNPPLGLFSNAAFETAAIEIMPGDFLTILTDGLTEVVDQHGEELGMGPIAAALPSLKDHPLESVGAAVLELARKHGARNDDQSMLFVRKLK